MGGGFILHSRSKLDLVGSDCLAEVMSKQCEWSPISSTLANWQESSSADGGVCNELGNLSRRAAFQRRLSVENTREIDAIRR